MKKQNITGFLSLFMGICLICVASIYGVANLAAMLGEVTGQTLIISLVALLVLAAAKKRKDVSAMLVFGGVFLVASVAKSYVLYEAGKEISDFANSMEAFTSGVEIEKREIDVQSASIFDVIEQHLVESQSIQQEHANKMVKFDIIGMLSPETLLSNVEIQKASEDLIEIKELLANTNKKTLSQVRNIEQVLSERNDWQAREALEGFLKNKEIGIDRTNRLYETQNSFMQAIENVLKLAESLNGKLVLEKEKLIFPDQSSLDRYNKLLATIGTLAGAEEKILREFEEFQQAKIEEMRKIQSL